jgi:hypothetical protein
MSRLLNLRQITKATGAFVVACLLLAQSFSSVSSARSPRGGLSLPAAVIAAGYTTRTFGPAVTLGTTVFNYNFGGVTPISGQSVQNGDGSITLPITDGSGFGAGIGTAVSTGGVNWTGIMFGPGWYAEAVIKFTATNFGGGFPFPAWWMESQDWLIGSVLQWPGQAAGFKHRIEFDLMQWPHNTNIFWLVWPSLCELHSDGARNRRRDRR